MKRGTDLRSMSTLACLLNFEGLPRPGPRRSSAVSPSVINGNWSEASISAAAKRCGMTPFVRRRRRAAAEGGGGGRRQLLPDETAPYFICGRGSRSSAPSSLPFSSLPSSIWSPLKAPSLASIIRIYPCSRGKSGLRERGPGDLDLDLHARIVAIATNKKWENA